MQTVAATFGLVFLAELGDKTQLVALSLGARHRFGSVAIGVVLAYFASTVLSVSIGSALGSALPTRAISLTGGILFLGFALHTLRSATGSTDVTDTDDDDRIVDGDQRRGATEGRSVVITVAVAMFVAELGDKTMIATGTLAARDSAPAVALGALLGITSAGMIGVAVGRFVGRSLPERTIRLGSAALFAVFGSALIVSTL